MTFETLLLNLLSGLMGAALGVLGATSLERRRETRQRMLALNAVKIELALLASSVELVAKEDKQNRTALRRPYWDKFGPGAGSIS